jgi:hypothetical protein
MIQHNPKLAFIKPEALSKKELAIEEARNY